MIGRKPPVPWAYIIMDFESAYLFGTWQHIVKLSTRVFFFFFKQHYFNKNSQTVARQQSSKFTYAHWCMSWLSKWNLASKEKFEHLPIRSIKTKLQLTQLLRVTNFHYSNLSLRAILFCLIAVESEERKEIFKMKSL